MRAFDRTNAALHPPVRPESRSSRHLRGLGETAGKGNLTGTFVEDRRSLRLLRPIAAAQTDP